MLLRGFHMYCKQFIAKQRQCRNLRGFSLIELLVSITIISIVTGIVIVRNNAFEGAVLLRNQTYIVAMAFREAQLLAVSGAGDTSQIQRYGVHVGTNSATRQRVIIFKDLNDNSHFDSSDEIINTILLDRRFRVSSISAQTTSGDQSNSSDFSTTFNRPNYDAFFRSGSNTRLGPAYIDIRRENTNGNSPEEVRRITITQTGQISVTNVSN